MKAVITISMRPGILDPESQAVESSLKGLGFSSVGQIKRSKVLEINIDSNSIEAAEKQADEMCRSLLANPVMETYTIRIES